VFTAAGAAIMVRQQTLTPEDLTAQVLALLQPNSPELQRMVQQTASLAVPDSAEKLADLVRQALP
jgi:UDP-N-acetylglucosamine--N-acetylmuramyl-(pentapeptide) pyrophosphoryl-undecaprenol N-acetylglucosamine transferase